MRTIFVVAVATTLLLAGCVGPEPVVTPTESDVEPVFASDEEALAAAEEVFGKYIEASNIMGLSGGTDLSAFDGLVTPRLFDEESATAQDLIENGRHLEGAFAYFGLSLQQLDQTNPPSVFLQAYACLDLSNVAYVDADGADPSGVPHAPIELVFTNEIDSPKTLLLERVDKWTGSDFCD